MRTISLRRFRDSIATLDERVIVQRRDAAGNYQIIGEWHPFSVGMNRDGETRFPTPVPERLTSTKFGPPSMPDERTVRLVAEHNAAFTPVPKPTRRK